MRNGQVFLPGRFIIYPEILGYRQRDLSQSLLSNDAWRVREASP